MHDEVLIDAAERATRYLSSLTGRTVAPSDEAVAELARLAAPLADHGLDPASVVATLDEVGSPGTVVSNGPRYFGFVTGGAHPVALAAATLASAWDQNGGTPIMSPTGAQLDRVAAAWCIDLLRLPSTATGVFCGGATVANLIGIVAGRDAVLRSIGWDAPSEGLIGAPAVTVVAGDEAHASLLKAVALAGLGRDRVERLPTDGQGRIRPGTLGPLTGPTIVALQSGNVNTGHSDPFTALVPEIRAAAGDHPVWIHVDGAFGLWAGASPELRSQTDGVDGADSWAVDAHKWLNVTYDCGLAVVADERALTSSMRSDASYLVAGAERMPMHLGIQMSQRVRAVEVWAVLRSLGRSGVAELVDRSCAQARRLASRLADAGVDVLNDVVLNQVLARFDDDATTDAVIGTVQTEGTCWAGGTTWRGQRAMRLSVSGWSTTDDDIDRSAEAIVACWRQIRNRREPAGP